MEFYFAVDHNLWLRKLKSAGQRMFVTGAVNNWRFIFDPSRNIFGDQLWKKDENAFELYFVVLFAWEEFVWKLKT